MIKIDISDARQIKGSNDTNFEKKIKCGMKSCGAVSILSIPIAALVSILLIVVLLHLNSNPNNDTLNFQKRDVLDVSAANNSVPLEERYALVQGCVDKHEGCVYEDRRGYFTALFLAILLGICGCDRCYMGFICCGICKAPLSVFIFIWPIIDLAMLLAGGWMHDSDGCCLVMGFKPLP